MLRRLLHDESFWMVCAFATLIGMITLELIAGYVCFGMEGWLW